MAKDALFPQRPDPRMRPWWSSKAYILTFVFLIVVTELNEEIIAGFHDAEDFIEAFGTQEAVKGFAGFSVIGNGQAGPLKSSCPIRVRWKMVRVSVCTIRETWWP